jgi:UDP-N-acetylglucosamine--N-acetylmuramyl-(pentapeptide) pyrophosphoryl-undecaprenol N-acetylglucosamine transferase
MNVLITGGGTGGHIFPGISIAQGYDQKDHELFWIGTPNSMEERLVPQQKWHTNMLFLTVNFQAIRGKGLKTLISAPFKLMKAVLQARSHLKKHQINHVIAMGGFVCLPVGLAAKTLGISLYVHEQNAIAGMSNKILSRFAKHIFTGFPHAFSEQKSANNNTRFQYVGNPVRKELIRSKDEASLDFLTRAQPDVLNILIIGGSLGASVFNERIPLALNKIGDERQFNIRHQAGEKHLKVLQDNYKGLEKHHHISLEPFIQNMYEAYRWADVIICRAGAMTVAEIAQMGVPALFVPFPLAVDDHQTLNAQFLVETKGAQCWSQNDFTTDKIVSWLKNLNRTQLHQRALDTLQAQNHNVVSAIIKKIDELSN